MKKTGPRIKLHLKKTFLGTGEGAMECKSEGKEKYQHSLNLLNRINSMKELAEMIDAGDHRGKGRRSPATDWSWLPLVRISKPCLPAGCSSAPREVVSHDITAGKRGGDTAYMYHASLRSVTPTCRRWPWRPTSCRWRTPSTRRVRST